MTRICHMPVVLTVSFALLLTEDRLRADPPRPNILLVHCHDLGQFLHCYGVKTVQTPNLDRLAAEGVRFSHSFCTAPGCSPSRASLFTGRWPHSNGVMGLCHANFAWDLNADERHLAQILREAGYATVAVGVLHETASDFKRCGYERHLLPSSAKPATDAAIDLLREFRDKPQRPFFLCVGFIEPHRLPYGEPDWPGALPGDNSFPGPALKPDRSLGVEVPRYLRDTEGTRRELAGLQGAIRHVDAQFGRLMAALEESGQDRQTLVLFTTDHGIAMPRAKASLYEPGVQVALLLRLPGRRGWKGGITRDEMISNIDYLPTLLELVGLPIPEKVQGRSFAPLLDGRPYQAREEIFTELTYHDYYDPRRAIRTHTHKLIVNFSSAPAFMDPSQCWRPQSDVVVPSNHAVSYHPYVELYDLAKDPWEQNDVAGRAEYASIRKSLLQHLHQHLVETQDPILQGAVTSPQHRRAVELLKGVPSQSVPAPVEARIPAPWTIPPNRAVTINFAESAQADAWLRHVVLGDPSFDSFARRPGNPVVRGKPPFEWPVNGFLFEDPRSGDWYSYVGHYLSGYRTGPGLPATHCRVYRSTDRGQSWKEQGPIFDDPAFRFDGDVRPATVAPDVSVVYAGDRYHMAYDWCTDNTTWDNAFHPPSGADSGVAYAWSEKPEGPFHRTGRPILRTSEMPRRFTLGQKYPRAYATTLIRRAHDWLTLTLTDSDHYFSWGLLAMTAADPAGPWSDPVMVLGVEGDRFFPPILESFPAFVHQGQVYAPHTSVAANRNFQVIYRAAIESAHRPEAWQLDQYGTAWHAEYVPHEGLGIWGQTFSGFVNSQSQFHVLFPSRETSSGLGTINFAVRPWDHPLRERGFVISGHEASGLTLLRCAWNAFDLDAGLTLRGQSARIVWGYGAPLGPDRHSSGSTPHPLTRTRHQCLELSAETWRVLAVDAAGKTSLLGSGKLDSGPSRRVSIVRRDDGRTELTIDGRPRWQGRLPPAPGPIGLMVEPHSHLAVNRFAVTGPCEPAAMSWLATEALMGAGVSMADWDMVSSHDYRFGFGAVRKGPGGRVKWNFRGRGFRLWSPKGPDFGPCEVAIDGRKLAELDLHSDRAEPAPRSSRARTPATDTTPWCSAPSPTTSWSIRWTCFLNCGRLWRPRLCLKRRLSPCRGLVFPWNQATRPRDCTLLRQSLAWAVRNGARLPVTRETSAPSPPNHGHPCAASPAMHTT